MAGRPRIVRSIQSYINHADTHAGLGPLKEGTAPQIGVSRNFWYNYQTQVSTRRPVLPLSAYQNVHWWNVRPTFTPSPKTSYGNFGSSPYKGYVGYGGSNYIRKRTIG